MNKGLILPVVAASCVALVGFRPAPNPLQFNMQDPKGVSGLSVSVDGPLEPLHGFANGISGTITFDPEQPQASKGKMTVDMSTLTVGSGPMTDAMRAEWCLDVKKFPTSEFVLGKITKVKKKAGGVTEFTATGDFTLHGVTKPITVSGTATYWPSKIKTRGGMEGVQGDLLIIRTTFSFNRVDFGIAPDLTQELVANRVTISMSSVGVCPR